MKNERCLNKKNTKKVVKIWIIFLSCTFLMGFYKNETMYIDLEEITIELGETLNNDKFDYINNYLTNSNYYLEDNVPKNEDGKTTEIGTYDYYIVYRNEERKYSRLTNKRSTISIIDTIKPEVQLKETSLEFEFGSDINVSDIATCIDLSECNLAFKDEIDSNKSGTQEVTIIATDKSNNTNEVTISIKIKDKPQPVTYYNYNYYSSSIKEMNNYNNNINSNLTEEQIQERRYALTEFAKQFQGNPYVYGGTSLTNGTDCSGFVMAIYNNFGYQLPRTSNEQGYLGITINYNELLPGDIITYITNGVGSHVGIYLGNGLMIHAGTPQTGITIIPMYEGYRVYNRIIY